MEYWENLVFMWEQLVEFREKLLLTGERLWSNWKFFSMGGGVGGVLGNSFQCGRG